MYSASRIQTTSYFGNISWPSLTCSVEEMFCGIILLTHQRDFWKKAFIIELIGVGYSGWIDSVLTPGGWCMNTGWLSSGRTQQHMQREARGVWVLTAVRASPPCSSGLPFCSQFSLWKRTTTNLRFHRQWSQCMYFSNTSSSSAAKRNYLCHQSYQSPAQWR